MLPKSELENVLIKSQLAPNLVPYEALTDWSSLFDQTIAEMMADPRLTDAEKQELLRQSQLPDDEWEPIQLPEGAEPVSVTLIKMRRGE